MEPELTSVGPAADALSAPDRGGAAPKPTEAWRDEDSGAAAAGDGGADASGEAATARSRSRPPRRRPWRRRAAVALVALQALWAVAIPLKNMAATLTPPSRPDRTALTAHAYTFNASGEDGNDAAAVVLGSELLPLLRQVARATLGSPAARRELERAGAWDLERVCALLPLEDFAAAARLYALELQSAAFPGAAFTPRPVPTSSSSDASSLVPLVLANSASSPAADNVEIRLACSPESAVLPAVRCTQVADGEPCPEDALASSDGDVRAADSALYAFEDVDLLAAAGGDGALSGLRNNVGLLFVVEFFAQAMGALLAARDWEDALRHLAFTQDAAEALPAGSASAFTAASDGRRAPLLLASDAFVVGVRASLLESSLLDACMASELTVALFYSRARVLHELREVLLALDLYGVRGGPGVLLPADTDAVLAPMWAANLSLTSGARASPVRREDRRFFGALVRVATREFADASFKPSRSGVASAQVAGSSLRMAQYLSFFPGLVSAFSYGTRPAAPSASGRAAGGAEEAEGASVYDFQAFALLGAAGAGINTFQEAVAGAGSAMVFPVAELPDADESEGRAAPDAWWDDEQRLANWFRALEADADTAPFRVLGRNLSIASVAPGVVADAAARCHRALFKALAKAAYLALVAAREPAAYLMFMGDVDEGHRAWLLRALDAEALFGETLWGAGDRLALPFRSGPFARSDDGSAWVAVPLLEAMLASLGRDETLVRLVRELDASFAALVPGSGGGVLHFPDARYCRVSGQDSGAALDGGPSLVVGPTDALDAIYAKISSGLAAGLEALLDEVPALAAAMYADVALAALERPMVSPQQLEGGAGASSSADAQRRGSPSPRWRFTALTAGLRKLWPPRTPPSAAVADFRASTRCYRMLELRALAATTRCLLEPRNTRVRWERLSSEPLRALLRGLWSASVLLNTLALAVVLKYLRKLARAYEATGGFARLGLPVARQLGLQATGVLKVSQSLLLLAAGAPLVLALHVPDDPELMPEQARLRPSKPVVDVLVTLSMSWVWKVGFEVANDWLRPWNWGLDRGGGGRTRPPAWLVGATYWQHDAIARLKWAALALVLAARLATRDGGGDSGFHARKLAATCCSSLALGACSSAVVALWRPRTARSRGCLGRGNGRGKGSGKVVDDELAAAVAERDEQDAVIAALVQQKLPLHRYGVLGRTARGGWSKAALIVEGWRLARRASDGREVLRKGAGEIVLPGEPLLGGRRRAGEGGSEDEDGSEDEVFSRSDVVPAVGLEPETREATATG